MCVKDREQFCACCDFCGKCKHEVETLISGLTQYICCECVELCNDIIRERKSVAEVSE